MAFLPFHITKRKHLKVVIAGGGYAGLATLTNLLQLAPDTEITLIDPGTHHIKITHLHETFRYPLTDFKVPFHEIEKRFGCRHIAASFDFDPQSLQTSQQTKQLVLDNEVLHFDYLVIASGCENIIDDQVYSDRILTLSDFAMHSGSDLLTQKICQRDSPLSHISLIGGGATGIQFLFEIRQFLNRIKSNIELRLIHSGQHVLEQFPAGFGAYAESRMQEMNIELIAQTHYRTQSTDKIQLQDRMTQQQYELPSDLTLLFLGKKQQIRFTANAFGQLTTDQSLLPNIFAAGDCANYQSIGSNTLTAQSAVRKGKLVARNVLRHAGFPGLLEPYLHQDLGYVVNLGASDAVGWLIAEGNLITGTPALAIKEIVETQFDLLLAGIDTYLV